MRGRFMKGMRSLGGSSGIGEISFGSTSSWGKKRYTFNGPDWRKPEGERRKDGLREVDCLAPLLMQLWYQPQKLSYECLTGRFCLVSYVAYSLNLRSNTPTIFLVMSHTPRPLR